jgi:hypothetical protein
MVSLVAILVDKFPFEGFIKSAKLFPIAKIIGKGLVFTEYLRVKHRGSKTNRANHGKRKPGNLSRQQFMQTSRIAAVGLPFLSFSPQKPKGEQKENSNDTSF